MLSALLIDDKLEASTPFGILKNFRMAPESTLPTLPDSARGNIRYKTTDDSLYVWRGTTLGWSALTMAIGGSAYATEAYVNAIASGLDPKASVRAATTDALPASSVSEENPLVLVADANGALPAQDGVSLGLDEALLVKNETYSERNGIYTVTALGDGSSPWVLTRRSDSDSNAKVTSGMFCWVSEGTVNEDTAWFLTTNDPIDLGTTGLTFQQFASMGQKVSKFGDTMEGTYELNGDIHLTGDLWIRELEYIWPVVLPTEASKGALVCTESFGQGALAWSKIVDDVIDSTAAITRTKLANGTANHLLINNGLGAMSSEATLGAARFPALTGDVTTAGGALETTIANNAVTYAKMQDISATQRLLGRNTAGAGDTEEVTSAQVLDWFSNTRGSILYRGNTAWSALTPGTAGLPLVSSGPGADPSYSGVLIVDRVAINLETLAYAATVDLDFNTKEVKYLALTGNVTFTTSNKGAVKSVQVLISCDASARTPTFPAWTWLVAAPTSFTASKKGILSLTAYGTIEAEVFATYKEQV